MMPTSYLNELCCETNVESLQSQKYLTVETTNCVDAVRAVATPGQIFVFKSFTKGEKFVLTRPKTCETVVSIYFHINTHTHALERTLQMKRNETKKLSRERWSCGVEGNSRGILIP